MAQSESQSNAPKSQPPKRPPAKEKTKKPSSGKGWAVLALLLALTSIGGGAYLAWRVEMQHVPQITEQIIEANSFEESIKNLAQQDQELRNLLTAPQDQSNLQLDNIGAAVDELRQSLQRTDADWNRKLTESVESLWAEINQSETDTDAWKIEEIVYLLVSGVERLKVSADVDSAKLTWQVADSQIDRLGDPRVLDAHAMVKDELKEIENLQQVDLAAISDRIFTLIEHVDTLPARDVLMMTENDQALSDVPSETSPEPPQDYFGQKVLNEIWQDLKSLVEVKKIDDTSLPPISPAAVPHLTQNIKLALFAAQIAALQNDETIYRNNLDYVRRTIADSFRQSSAEVKQFLNQVNELAQTPVALRLPDLSGALTELQDVLNRSDANG